MSVFQRILVGYDGSFEAQAALRVALELARDSHPVQVTAVAVARLPRAPATVGEVQEERAAGEDRARQTLAAAAAYARDCGHQIDTEILLGRTASALIRAAAEHRADLLVIGAASHRRAWARVRPATMPAVARRAPCPVLVAHQ
jgi:nucleotide-binding universal stress UspA family protein